MIGVNNRNLHTFKVDLNTSLELVGQMPESVVKVAESGIETREDIERLQSAGFNAFLIGESLMRAERPGDALRSLTGGRWLCRDEAGRHLDQGLRHHKLGRRAYLN